MKITKLRGKRRLLTRNMEKEQKDSTPNFEDWTKERANSDTENSKDLMVSFSRKVYIIIK